jgi:D-methionine transport system substrate-binding protein
MKVYKFLLAAFLIGMLAITSCTKKDQGAEDKVIKFAVSNIKVYEDTTIALSKEVEALGYKLEYTLLSDYVQTNSSVESGEYFANYHQHEPYMNEFNNTHNGHLAVAFEVFTDRSGLFSRKYKSLNELPIGAQISIPNDAGNNFRPLVILADAGLIKLREGVEPIKISQKDILENPKKLRFIEVDYTMLSRSLEEADAGYLYATVAADAGFDFNRDVLAAEREELWAPDIIAVHQENVGSEKAKILEKAYKTDSVKKALRDAFGGRDILLPTW